MSFKKVMIIISGMTIVMFIISLMASYAWYSYSEGTTDFKSITTSAELNIIYAQSSLIKTTTSLPIKDIEINTQADSNTFTVSTPRELYDYQIILSIALTNISIDEELKSTDFKYELLQNNEIISEGNGLNFQDKTLVLKDNLQIDPTKTYTYKLIIWLSETGESQNNLMNKSFQAQIQVNSIAKK